MPKEVLTFDIRFNFDESSVKKGASGFARVDKVAERLNKTTSRTSEQYEKIGRSAQQSASKAAAANRRLAETQELTNRNLSRGNQALFTFGDALNDAQQFQFGFGEGLRAVGNNLTFASEQISNLSSKAGGARGAFRALAGSFFGPGGLILAINLVVSGLTLFGDKLFESEEAVSDLDKEIDGLNKQISTTVRLVKEIRDIDDPLGISEIRTRVQALTDEQNILDVRLETLRDTEDRIREIERIFKDQGPFAERDPELLSELGRLRSLRKDIVETYGSESSIKEQIVSIDEKRLEKEREIQRIREGAESRLVELARARKQLDEEARRRAEAEPIEPNIVLDDVIDDEFIANAEAEAISLRDSLVSVFSVPDVGPLSQFLLTDEQRKKKAIENAQEILGVNKQVAMEMLGIDKEISDARIRDSEERTKAEIRLAELEKKRKIATATTAVQAGAQALGTLFEKNKAVQVASAVIDAGAAIVRQFSDLPFPAAVATSALIAARTASQIQKIVSTEPGDSDTPSAGGGISSGFRSSERQGGGSGQIGAAAASRSVARPTVIENNITLAGEFDDRVVSIKAEQGRQKRNSKAFKVNSD